MLSDDIAEVQQDPNSKEMFFAAVNETNVKKFQNMDNVEKEIFKVLQQSGDLGCTIGELKTSVLTQNPDINVNQTQITAILKQMDKKGHVKSIKGQQQNRKKIYMLAEIEPCSTVTGGPISGTDP